MSVTGVTDEHHVSQIPTPPHIFCSHRDEYVISCDSRFRCSSSKALYFMLTSWVCWVIIHLISNSQYTKMKWNYSKHYIAVRSHQRSLRAHRYGGLKSSHIHEATEIIAGETRNNETQLTIIVQFEAINNISRYDRHQELMDIWVSPKIIMVSSSTMITSGSQRFDIYSLQMSTHY